MSLSSKSTIIFGLAFILVLTAIAVLIIRVLRLQQKVLDLEKIAVIEKQRAWLVKKQQAALPPAKSTRDIVLDVLMEIEELKNGQAVVESEPLEVRQEKVEEQCGPDEDCEEEAEEEMVKTPDPRSRPFNIFTSLFGGKPATAKADIIEIMEVLE